MTDTPVNADAPPTPKGGSLLTRKVGGVPIKWLALIAVVAVIGGILYRRYKTAHTAITPPATATAPVSADTGPTTGDGVYSTAGGTNLGGGFAYSGNGSGSSTYSTLGTNAQWATAAANGLIGQGLYAPLDVENALSGYIAGTPLTPAQNAIVNAAIAAYGSPPEAVLASSVATSAPVTSYARTTVGTDAYVQAHGLYKLTVNGDGTKTKQHVTLADWEQNSGGGQWLTPDQLAQYRDV